MTLIGKNILKLEKPNGTFIVFGEYDSEEDFADFLDYLKDKLSADVKDVKQNPYSKSASIRFPFGEAEAICQGGIGCAVRVDPEKEVVLSELVSVCARI